VSPPRLDVDALWAKTRPNAQGLLPCVTQDLRTRAVLMLAWVSKEALAHALTTGNATYFSRSRNVLWEKGATSGHTQRLIHVRLDCDGDTLCYLVEARLPACHEGTDTCFSYRRIGNGWHREPVVVDREDAPHVMEELDTVLDARARQPAAAKPSYTRSLLDAGLPKQAAKIREESEELLEALDHETDARVVAETADLLYHVAVALKGRGLSFRAVFEELERRFGVSGLDEKAARGRSAAPPPDPDEAS
jgi:phosphoribosyl-ATP pyrophosphohydrolase/phosphoribosyl-AMP cyclohydrolase